jgi:hypothetical protein
MSRIQRIDERGPAVPNQTTTSGTPPTTYRRRRPSRAAGVAVLLLALAGCGDDDGGAATTAAPTTTPAASVTTTPATTATATATTRPRPTVRPPAGPAPCTGDRLRASAGRQEGAAGSVYLPIVFRNDGRTCTLRGYPAVAGLDDAGNVVAVARPAGGAVTAVTLRPGRSASALVRSANVAVGDAPTCAPDLAALRVTPPGTSSATTLDVSLPSCGGRLDVGAVVPGTTGR